MEAISGELSSGRFLRGAPLRRSLLSHRAFLGWTVLWGGAQGSILRGSSPEGELSSGRTCFLFDPSCHVDSSHVSEPDLFLLPHRTGSHIIIYILMEIQSHIHNNASPQLAMSHLWRKLVPSRNLSRCVKNRARTT